MRSGRANSAAWQWHRVFRGGTIAGYTEGQLLDRFVSLRDEIAFEALVARHGPMVLSVCRRMLSDPSDVDDAFQATFLVFVRRAATIRDRERLGNWLYGVAHRVASRARQEASRRHARETGGTETLPDRRHALTPSEDLTLLHHEIRRLPEKYRAVVVLCDLERQSHEDAARQLNWPVGTVKGRLFRARNLLRERLIRRGVSLSAGAIGAALGNEVRGSIVTTVLLDATVQSGIGLATGQTAAAGLATASSVAFFQGAHHAMFLSKLKIAGALMAAGVVVAGSGALAHPKGGAGGSAVTSANQSDADSEGLPQDGPETNSVDQKSLNDALQARAKIAHSFYEAAVAFYETGKSSIDRAIDASRRLMEAELAAADSKDAIREPIRSHAKRMQRLVERETSKMELGTGEIANLGAARLAAADANLELVRIGEPVETPLPPHREPLRRLPLPLQDMPSVPFTDVNQHAPPVVAEDRDGQAKPDLDHALAKQVRDARGLRFVAARSMYDAMLSSYDRQQIPIDRLIDASRKLAEAEQESQESIEKKLVGAGGHLDRMMNLLQREKAKLEVGKGSWPNEREAAIAVAEAQLRVTQLTQRKFSPKGDRENAGQKKKEEIEQALKENLPMPFGQPTPLSDVIKYLRTSTISPDLPDGLPIYVDASILEKVQRADVTINVDGIPLGSAFRLVLRQVDLGYSVRDGLVLITSLDSEEYRNRVSPKDVDGSKIPFPDTISLPRRR